VPDVAGLIEGANTRARALLEPAVYDYFAGGSGDEIALAEASAAWRHYRIRPRVLRDVSTVDTTVTVLDTILPSPVAVAPIAYQGLLSPDGEVAMARGAQRHLTVVSTRASRTIEEIAAATTGPWWFQVYVTADRKLTTAMVQRAAAAGASALVLTGDTPYVARKARAGRPVGLGDDMTITNFAQHLQTGADPARDIEQSPAVTVVEVERLRAESGLPVLVKGVLRADDTRRCLDVGAAGVIVSNHGGRQLDRAVATATALPEVVAAAGGAPVLVDGGVRSGLDILVALALGAKAVLVGRPLAWALASDGAEGVATLLANFADEVAHVLGLAGCAGCTEATADLVRLV
jgi:4-hydroxymandelate oxidase